MNKVKIGDVRKWDTGEIIKGSVICIVDIDLENDHCFYQYLFEDSRTYNKSITFIQNYSVLVTQLELLFYDI